MDVGGSGREEGGVGCVRVGVRERCTMMDERGGLREGCADTREAMHDLKIIDIPIRSAVPEKV